MKGVNTALAIGLHVLVGLVVLLATQVFYFGELRLGVAALLWLGGLFFQLDWREKSPGAVWLVPIVFPFAAWYTALGVVVLVGGLIWIATQSRVPAPAKPALSIPRDPRREKLQAVQLTAATLEAQLRDLLQPMPVPVPATAPAPAVAPRPEPARPSPRSPLRERLERDVDWSDFLGARALAWAGGLVTVLGIVFFFILAANRGWLLPEIRLVLGVVTSVAVVGAGFWMRSRYGALQAAVVAAGAGISGGYATLLAATALYGFVPQGWALVAAAAIAAGGAATALAWDSETVAGFGLLGAILVPLMVFVQDGKLSFVGTAFVGVMLAATALVCLRAGWRYLLLIAGAASLLQIAGLAAQTDETRVLWLSTAFWLLYLGIGLAWQVVRGDRALEPAAGAFVITGGALSLYSCLFLVDGHVGLALLAVAGLYGLLAAAFLRLDEFRDLASLLGAVGAVVGAVAAAELLTGVSLTAVWSAVGILLAWLARRSREPRLLLPALAYAVLGAGYALAVEARPEDLFIASAHPGKGAGAIVAAAVAFLLFAHYSRGQATSGSTSSFGRVVDDVTAALSRDARPYVWAGGTLLLYAASLGTLELFVHVADFEWGHVALAGLWSFAGLALVVAGTRLGRHLDVAGLALLAVTTVEVFAYDAMRFPEERWASSFLLVAAAGALAGFEYGRRADFARRLIPAGCAAGLSALLTASAIDALADGDWHRISAEGGALGLAAGIYAALALPVFRSRRDLATIYWSIALLLGTASLALLVADFWLVLAGAVASTCLVLVGRRVREWRLELASVAAFALAAAYAICTRAQPDDLFTTVAHPAASAPSVLALVGAASIGAVALTRRELRIGAQWIAAALLLYAASLATLELFVRIADFGWGHVALAGLWGAVALGLAEPGLRRNRLELQIAGAGLLGAAVAETVAFDWAELSTTKAAVGSLVLATACVAGGVEYGRLSARLQRIVPAGISLGASALLTAAAVVSLAGGTWYRVDVEGGALVLAGLVYAAIAASVFRRERDLATYLWAIGLGFGAAGLVELVSGFWLVLAGSLGAVALALLGDRLREDRLQLAGAAVYIGGLAYALAVEAPPRDFLVESLHPGNGVPALLVLALAAGILAWRLLRAPHARIAALAVTGALCFYAVSLGLLELAELATDADVGTKFQRGHTAVSAFWGLVSMGFLYVGLTRRRRELRIAGFALFGISLAKLFLYDLAFLSSLTRALSFIAVGAVLLFAGFFYQRLSEQLETRDGTGRGLA